MQGYAPQYHGCQARHHDSSGAPISATIMIVNSKARGIEARRKLPVTLPMRGSYLSPGLALWTLVHRTDPVPADRRATTPLFRDPATNKILTVDGLRASLRAILSNIGRDGTAYGAHSLRIGGATANMAFCQALAPRSSKTSVDGAATRISVTYASAADSTCPT